MNHALADTATSRAFPRSEMRRSLFAVLAIALVVAVGTWLLGWWAVPIIAVSAGAMLAGRARAGVMISFGAGIAWIVLLGIDAMSGHLLALAALLGRILPVPWPLLLVVTITYVMLMAWSAAVIGEAVRRAVKPLRAA